MTSSTPGASVDKVDPLLSKSTLNAVEAQYESIQIHYCRVFCIFFMAFTHMKLFEDSIVYTGALGPLGHFIIDYLGRASVAALSFISGYLLALSTLKKATTKFIPFLQGKISTVLVPMLVWNLVYIILVVSAFLVMNHYHRIIPVFSEGDPLGIVNIFTGLSGDPANFSLFFIRDLFVSQVLVFAVLHFLPWLRIFGVALLGLAALFVPLDPIIFRPPVLLFLCAGALLVLSGNSLRQVSRAWAFRLFCVLVALPLIYIQTQGLGDVLSEDALNIYKRFVLTCLVLAGSVFLVGSALDGWAVRLSGVAFIFYLMSLPFTSFFWAFWSKLFPDTHSISYAFYFFGAPALGFAFALVLGKALRHYPRLARRLGTRA